MFFGQDNKKLNLNFKVIKLDKAHLEFWKAIMESSGRSTQLAKLNNFLKCCEGDFSIKSMKKFRKEPPICASSKRSFTFNAWDNKNTADDFQCDETFDSYDNYEHHEEDLPQWQIQIGDVEDDQSATSTNKSNLTNDKPGGNLKSSFGFNKSNPRKGLTINKPANKKFTSFDEQKNVVNAEANLHVICPLCFRSLKDKQELEHHLLSSCVVIETGLFEEPKSMSIFQITSHGIKCSACKLRIDFNKIMEHRLKIHPNSVVQKIFCSICQESIIFTLFEISRHCDTEDHQELVKFHIDQRRINTVQLLRKNCYCSLCKMIVQVPKIAKHVKSESHTEQTNSETGFWCYFCEMSVQPYNVTTHFNEITHQHNSSQRFYCLFCRQVWSLSKFIDHITECISEN